MWTDGCLEDYTDLEYNQAKARVEKRTKVLEGITLFPLKKDEYVEYNELLILKTIYGKRIADMFLERLTGIKELINDCQTQSKTKGTVTALDGRELFSRSPHSALNLLLQGSAGVVAKQWMSNYYRESQRRGFIVGKDFWQSAYVHDEFQVTTLEEKAKEMCEILEASSLKVTEQLNINLPIASDAMIGDNWSDTH